MVQRIIAIVFIFIVATIAWTVLGATIMSRTYDSSAASSSKVESTWGTQQDQAPPAAFFKTPISKKVETMENGKKVVQTLTEEVITSLPVEGSKINVNLDLAHRQKGLLWYSTYKVDFMGHYVFRNPSDKEQAVQFDLKF